MIPGNTYLVPGKVRIQMKTDVSVQKCWVVQAKKIKKSKNEKKMKKLKKKTAHLFISYVLLLAGKKKSLVSTTRHKAIRVTGSKT